MVPSVMWGSGLGAFLVLLYVTSPFLVVFFILVFLSVKRARQAEKLAKVSKKKLAVAEVLWLLLVASIWTVINVSSLSWIPAGIGTAALAVPAAGEQVLEIEAFMWGYNLSTTTLEAGTPIRIVAWSKDTIHSTGIYSPDGELLITLMLMPGMREQVVLNLEPGVYRLRCLEYCGDGHAYMSAIFNVVGRTGGE